MGNSRRREFFFPRREFFVPIKARVPERVPVSFGAVIISRRWWPRGSWVAVIRWRGLPSDAAISVRERRSGFFDIVRVVVSVVMTTVVRRPAVAPLNIHSFDETVLVDVVSMRAAAPATAAATAVVIGMIIAMIVGICSIAVSV
jgi:hypothetical protein